MRAPTGDTVAPTTGRSGRRACLLRPHSHYLAKTPRPCSSTVNWTRSLILASLLSAALVATAVQSATGVRELRLAQQHLSAVLIVQRWAEIAYRVGPPPTETCEPTPPETVVEPDGDIRLTFRTADCSEITQVFRPDS